MGEPPRLSVFALETEIRELYADYVKSRSIGIRGESEVRQVNRG